MDTPCVTEAKELLKQMSPAESKMVFVEILASLKNDQDIVDLFFTHLTDNEQFHPLPGPDLTYEELERRRMEGLAGDRSSLHEALAVARKRMTHE